MTGQRTEILLCCKLKPFKTLLTQTRNSLLTAMARSLKIVSILQAPQTCCGKFSTMHFIKRFPLEREFPLELDFRSNNLLRSKLLFSSFGRSMAASAKPIEYNGSSPKKEEKEMLRLLMKEDFKEVINLLRKLQDRGQATLFAYNLALSALAKLREADGALKTFEALQTDTNGAADHYSFGSLSSALCRAGRVDEAVSLLNTMVTTNKKPNIIIMNTLLHGAVTARRIDLANWIRAVIREEGLVLNEMTLIGVVRLAALQSNAEMVTKAWSETVQLLVQSNVSCSVAAIASLAVAYSQCDAPDLAIEAIQILSHSLKQGDNVVSAPTLFSAAGIPYHTGLDNYMLHVEPLVGLKLNTIHATSHWARKDHIHAAYASTANAYSRAGKYSSVRKVVSLLEAIRGLPYAPAIIAQLKGLVRKELSEGRKLKGFSGSYLDAKDSQSPLRHVDELVTKDLARFGLKPTKELCNALLREQARHGGLKSAVAQWKTMMHGNALFIPDVYSYGTLLAAHAAEMDVDGAWDTWRAMKEANIIADEACLVSLISAHARRNKTTSGDPRALNVLAEMEVMGRFHTVATGTALSRVLGHLGLAKEAFEVIQDLKSAGHTLGTRSFNTLLHVVTDCKLDISTSVAVLRDMTHYGCKPDKNSFHALISNSLNLTASGCSFDFDRSKHESLAGRLSTFFLTFMMSSGLQPETDTFNVSLRSAIRSNRLSTARDLIQEMRSQGISCNERTIFTILNAGRWSNNRHSQQEMNWILEESIKLGARPREKVVLDLIHSALGQGDVAQAVWYLGLCVTYRLVHPKRSLEMIQDLDSKVFPNQVHVLIFIFIFAIPSRCDDLMSGKMNLP